MSRIDNLFGQVGSQNIEEKELLHLLLPALQSAEFGLMITDCEGKIEWINNAVCTLSGYSQEELLGMSARIFKSGQNQESIYADLWQTLQQKKVWKGVLINRKKDGSFYSEEITIAPVLNSDHSVHHYVAIKRDISERVETEQLLAEVHLMLEEKVRENEAIQLQLKEQATRDKLSGVYNRRYFEDALLREYSRSKRSGEAFSLAMLDIDHFKKVNDNYGHEMGDNVISALGAMMNEHSRAHDSVCRYGGEEFVVLLPNTDLEGGMGCAENWRQRFAELRVSNKEHPQGIVITISIGVAQWQPGEEAKDTLRRADAALYQAKHQGRNRVIAAQ